MRCLRPSSGLREREKRGEVREAVRYALREAESGMPWPCETGRSAPRNGLARQRTERIEQMMAWWEDEVAGTDDVIERLEEVERKRS